MPGAPVRMIVPTCAPRSAAVSRPGTSPLTSCTRSMWRAVAMTSSRVRSNGSVPLCFARSAALVSRSNLAFFPPGPLGSAAYTPSTSLHGVRHPSNVLNDREACRSDRISEQKRAGVSSMGRDARGGELVVVIGRKGAPHDRAGGAKVDRKLVRYGGVLEVGHAFRREQKRE